MPEAVQSIPLASIIGAIAVVLLLGLALSIAFLIRRRKSKGAGNAESLTTDAAFSKTLSLFGEAMEPELLTHNGLRLITHFLHARYGLIFGGPDDSSGLTLVAAVDTERLREPSGPPLQVRALPEITSSVVRARAKILRKEEEARAIKEALGLDPFGEAMIAPTKLEAERNAGLLLLAGLDRPNWSSTDLQTLEAWAAYLGRRINSPPGVVNGPSSRDADVLRGELRLALEELAEVSAVESGGSMAQVGTLTSLLMEMREPIAYIQGYNEMLRGGSIGEIDSEQRKFLDHIHENTSQLDLQLTALLNLVRTPPGTIQSHIEIRDVVDVAENQVSSDLTQMEIELQRELPESLPRVAADPDLLRQVIVILFERAIRISPSNSQIRIAAQADEGDWVSIAVSDQGPGVPAEDLGRVFQPGVASEGADLGLPQVKALTESLGGRVWIGSEMGAGSTVTVMIPVSEGTVANAS